MFKASNFADLSTQTSAFPNCVAQQQTDSDLFFEDTETPNYCTIETQTTNLHDQNWMPRQVSSNYRDFSQVTDDQTQFY